MAEATKPGVIVLTYNHRDELVWGNVYPTFRAHGAVTTATKQVISRTIGTCRIVVLHALTFDVLHDQRYRVVPRAHNWARSTLEAIT
jgi:hypothetical protein